MAEARLLLTLAVEDWLAGELSKWVTFLLLCATFVGACLALVRELYG
jgi:hypothetical protein